MFLIVKVMKMGGIGVLDAPMSLDNKMDLII